MDTTHVTAAATTKLTADEIPIIDIGPLRDGTDKLRVARKLCQAASQVGFLYVTNHGVDEETLERARRTGLEFFRLTDEQKLAASTNQLHHGYLKPGSSQMYDDAELDLKESFNWGIEMGPEALACEPGNPLIGPNRWPPSMPDLKTGVYPFFDAASDCAEQLLRGFALGAGLDEEYFIKRRDRPISRGSLQYYPPQPSAVMEPQFGVAAHTDFGMLTVLCQDAVGGLQLQRPNREWVEVPPVAETFVVNVGDLLNRWSNHRFRSTPHRVLNTSGRERLSLVLAYDPNFEAVVDPRAFCRDDETPVGERTTCGDYLLWRFEKAFSYRRTNTVSPPPRPYPSR